MSTATRTIDVPVFLKDKETDSKESLEKMGIIIHGKTTLDKYYESEIPATWTTDIKEGNENTLTVKDENGEDMFYIHGGDIPYITTTLMTEKKTAAPST